MSGFADPILGGQNTLIRDAIKSPDYVPGVSGWSINKDGTAEFNSLDIRGTFNGTDFIINSSGLFFYSSTPAAGNLSIAIATADGTDEFGNQYFSGVSTQLSGIISLLAQGAVYCGSAAQLFGTGVPGNIVGAPGTMSMNSGESSNTDNSSGIVTESQSFSGVTGGQIILSAGKITGALAIPQTTPAANATAINNALRAAGIFKP